MYLWMVLSEIMNKNQEWRRQRFVEHFLARAALATEQLLRMFWWKNKFVELLSFYVINGQIFILICFWRFRSMNVSWIAFIFKDFWVQGNSNNNWHPDIVDTSWYYYDRYKVPLVDSARTCRYLTISPMEYLSTGVVTTASESSGKNGKDLDKVVCELSHLQ